MPARHMPLIGIPTCLRKVNERIIHGVNDKYPTAVIDSTGCLPILIPAVGSKVDICGLLDRLDGLLLTGSPSNVHPSQYGGEPSHPETLHDPERDATTLPLIREAVRRDLPILAICRGIQELMWRSAVRYTSGCTKFPAGSIIVPAKMRPTGHTVRRTAWN